MTDDDRLEANRAIAKALGWTVWCDPRPGGRWFAERPSTPGHIEAMPLPDYVGDFERHRAEVERLTQIIAGKEVALGLKESALAAERKRVGELEAALGFYAECEHWHVGGEFIPASPHSEYKPDCGDTARAALAGKEPGNGS